MKCSEMIYKLEALSPSSFAEDYDNVGLLIGSTEKEIHSVLIALDATKQVVEEAVSLDEVRVYGNAGHVIETAAICPGSGKSVVKTAIEIGVDVLITSEIDHNDALDAMEQGLTIIDAGHYGLEKIFVPYLKEYIGREMSDITVYVAKESCPFWIV